MSGIYLPDVIDMPNAIKEYISEYSGIPSDYEIVIDMTILYRSFAYINTTDKDISIKIIDKGNETFLTLGALEQGALDRVYLRGEMYLKCTSPTTGSLKIWVY